MKTTAKLRFVGRIVSTPGNDGFGFIGLDTVEKEDGSPHGLETTKDIFVHQDDSSAPIKAGTRVIFDVVKAPNRPEGELRAQAVTQYIEAELLPAGEPVPGLIAAGRYSAAHEMSLLKQDRHPLHRFMKSVPSTTVEAVIANRPMEQIPRQIGELYANEQAMLLQVLLRNLFPRLEQFGADFNPITASDELLESRLSEADQGLTDLGLTHLITELRPQISAFREVRGALRMIVEERLVRPDCIIPIHYLPDLFMAVPVWFFWTENGSPTREISGSWTQKDPRPHKSTLYFCDLFPKNRRWADTFQMFNRRVRTMRDYSGNGVDFVPPFIAKRMKRAVQLFDYVVIATPYLDLAGMDWNDLEWIKSIDPYLLAFKKGVPYFFILGRFSDTGTFPLFNALVADTIEFLKANQRLLKNFNEAQNPYWYRGNDEGDCQSYLGDHLMAHVDALLGAFEQGDLFNWLRGGAASSAVVTQ